MGFLFERRKNYERNDIQKNTLWKHSCRNAFWLYYICDEFDPKIESIRCHGGITCISTGGILKGNVENYREGHWIGWDYLHPGDYEANMHPLGRKWTTKEILDDVKNVIKQLVQM